MGSTCTGSHRSSLTRLLAVDTAMDVRGPRWHRRRLISRWLWVWVGSAVEAGALSFFVALLSRPGQPDDTIGAWFSVWVTSYVDLAPLAAGTSVSTLAAIGMTLFVATSVAEARPSPPRLGAAELERRAAIDAAIFGVYSFGAVLVWLHLPPIFGTAQRGLLDALIILAASSLLSLLAALQSAPPELRERRIEQARGHAGRAGEAMERMGQEDRPSIVRAWATLTGIAVVTAAVAGTSMWVLLPELRAIAGVRVLIGWTALTAALHVGMWPIFGAGAVVERYVRRAPTYFHWWFAAAVGIVDASILTSWLALHAAAAGLGVLVLVITRVLLVSRIAKEPLARSIGYRRAARLRDAYEATARDLEALD